VPDATRGRRAAARLAGDSARAARRPEPGLVEIELAARPAEVMVEGRRASLWTYGGSFPGARVSEGETV
jgi:hypothetical protein